MLLSDFPLETNVAKLGTLVDLILLKQRQNVFKFITSIANEQIRKRLLFVVFFFSPITIPWCS